MPALSQHELRRVAALLAERSGLQCELEQTPALAEILARRVDELAGGVAAYLRRLADPDGGELRILAPRITVPESFFFREREHFTLLCELAAGFRQPRPLRVLCAGCAGGEEPYSAAIALCESGFLGHGAGVEIRAFDLNPEAIAAARTGRYSAWALRATPGVIQENYFQRRGPHFVLAPRIRQMVSFEVDNLMAPARALCQPGAYDAIFCRNVLMYLTPRAAGQACSWLARALAPAAPVFIGQAETLRGLSDRLQPDFAKRAVFYRPTPASAHAPRAGPEDEPVLPRAFEPSETAKSTAKQRPPSHDEAILPAVKSARRGDLNQVERHCQMLVAAGHNGATINYLLALCREYAGDYQRALEHDRLAIALDPEFAVLLREDSGRLAMFSATR